MQLREVTLDDLDEVARLHTRIWQVAYRDMVPDERLDLLDWRDRRAAFAPWFDGADPQGTWIAARVDDAIVGHVLAGPLSGRHGELHLLYVAPEQWGTGLARELLAVGERILRRSGCETAELWTFEANERSQAFYQRHGWTIDGRSRVDEDILAGESITEIALHKALLTDQTLLNRSYWADLAEFFVPLGERAWGGDPAWGVFGLPENDVGLLDGVAGANVVEIGCGTGYVSKWCLSVGAASVVGLDNSPAQLATARRLAAEHDTTIPFVHGDGHRLPFADESFDLAISEYGAAIWCDPAVWIPEAARVLRPGGRLVFLGNSVLLMTCIPEWDDVHASTELRRPLRGLGRMDWLEVDGVQFHVSHGEMIRILTGCGLQVVELKELYAPEGATSDFPFVTGDWASQWPVEEVWIAVKP